MQRRYLPGRVRDLCVGVFCDDVNKSSKLELGVALDVMVKR
jgi:hypothetical protein